LNAQIEMPLRRNAFGKDRLVFRARPD